MNNWDMIRHLRAEGFIVLMPRQGFEVIDTSVPDSVWDLTEYHQGVEIIRVPDELKFDVMFQNFVTIEDKAGFVLDVQYSPYGEVLYVLLDTTAVEDKPN